MGRDGPGDRARIIAGDGESYLQARKYGSALFAVLALVAERRRAWAHGASGKRGIRPHCTIAVSLDVP
jgi:hypothetical protein